MSDVKDPVQIAVSYSRTDAAKVEPLLEALRAEGLSVWFDKDIPGGTLWEEIIARKYRAAGGLAFFISRASLESQRCFEEVSTARTLNKPIFPVLIEKLKLPDELPDRFVLTLQARNTIDLYDSDAEAGTQKLLKAFEAHDIRPGAPVPRPVSAPRPAPQPAAPPARPVAAEASSGASGGRGALILAAVVALLAIAGAALWGLGLVGGGGGTPAPQASVAPDPATPSAPSAPKPDAPAPAPAKPEDAKPAGPPAAPAGDPSAPVSLAKTAFTQGEPITVEIGRDPGLAEGKRGYLTLAEPGSETSAYVRYVYIERDKSRVTIPPVMTPGAYELRFFPNESETSRDTDIALTLPVTVTEREGVEFALDGVVEIGKPVTIRFAGLPGNDTDMITVAEASMGPGEYKRYAYTKGKAGGTVTLAPVMQPGAYEIRLYFANATGENTVIRSLAVEVPERAAPGLTLNTNPVAEGERIEAGFTGMPGNDRDYITLARPDMGPGEYVSYAYTKGKTDGSVELAPVSEAGEYELRALYDDTAGDAVVQATLPITIGPAGEVSIALDGDRTELGDAEPIRVRFSGFPGNRGDYVAIAYATAEPGAYEVYKSTGGKKDGEIVFEPLGQVGDFEIRAFFDGDKTIRGRLFVSFFESPAPTMAPDKGDYLPGERIVVSILSFPGNQDDSIAIAAAGAPGDEVVSSAKTRGQGNGKVNLTAPNEPGAYELRAFFAGQTGEAAIRARVPFTVTAPGGAEAAGTAEEQRCASLVQGQVPWNQAGDTAWDEANIAQLCAGVVNAEERIACFSAQLPAHDDWERAIADCKAAETATDSAPPRPALTEACTTDDIAGAAALLIQEIQAGIAAGTINPADAAAAIAALADPESLKGADGDPAVACQYMDGVRAQLGL